MAYDFDLHASLYRFVRDPSPQLREDRGKREVFHRAVCSWFRDVELREAGALLESEVAEAGRQGIAIPEAATYVGLVHRHLQLMQDHPLRFDLPFWSDDPEMQAFRDDRKQRREFDRGVAFFIDQDCGIVESLYCALGLTEPILPWLPGIAGLVRRDVVEIRGLKASSAHAAICKFGLQTTFALSQALRLGSLLEEYVRQVPPGRKRRPKRGRAWPKSPADLCWDDRELLKQLAQGDAIAKELAAVVQRSEAHVRHRVSDLRSWGLVGAESKPYRITDEGRRWRDELG